MIFADFKLVLPKPAHKMAHLGGVQGVLGKPPPTSFSRHLKSKETAKKKSEIQQAAAAAAAAAEPGGGRRSIAAAGSPTPTANYR
jgi:hypothetical protein